METDLALSSNTPKSQMWHYYCTSTPRMTILNVPIKSSMRRDLMKASLTLLLLIAVAVPKAHAQDSFLIDRTLSQLRGVWEYRTYRDKWTIVFESDHKMLLDREPADYTLIPGAIRIQDGDGSR